MTTTRMKFYDVQLILCSRSFPEVKLLISTLLEYDCFLINRCEDFDGEGSELIPLIASAKSDWIEVFGYNAEIIHDAIDRASVANRRQKAVGDGIPMTSWNDYDSAQSVAEYIRTGGHGVSDNKLLFFIGSIEEEKAFWNLLDCSRDYS